MYELYVRKSGEDKDDTIYSSCIHLGAAGAQNRPLFSPGDIFVFVPFSFQVYVRVVLSHSMTIKPFLTQFASDVFSPKTIMYVTISDMYRGYVPVHKWPTRCGPRPTRRATHATWPTTAQILERGAATGARRRAALAREGQGPMNGARRRPRSRPDRTPSGPLQPVRSHGRPVARPGPGVPAER